MNGVGHAGKLRVLELVALRREQVDLHQGLLHVRRRKHGLPSTQPLRGPELRALRQLWREYPETPYVFVTERQAPMTEPTFRKLVARAGEAARLGLPIHIESTFATVRLRTDKTRGCVSRAGILAMVFMLVKSAERHWRKLNGIPRLAEVIEGISFKDGVREDAEKIAA
jgi:hypothetical protein